MIFINVKMLCGLRSGCKQELIIYVANQKTDKIYIIFVSIVMSLINIL